MPVRVFQVAYNQQLLRVREMILQQKGFTVHSVIGNSEACRLLGEEAFGDSRFDCFIIGWSGSYEEKKSITEWIKQKWPTIPVVAIHDQFVRIPKADITATHDTPEEWIRAVEAATRNFMGDQRLPT